MKKSSVVLLVSFLLLAVITSCNKDNNSISNLNQGKPATDMPSLLDKCLKLEKLEPRYCAGTRYDYQHKVTIKATIGYPVDIFYLWLILGSPSSTPISIPKIAPFTYELHVWKYDPALDPCTRSGMTINPIYSQLQSVGIIQTTPSSGDYINCSSTYPGWFNYSTYPSTPPSGSWTTPHYYIGCCDPSGGTDGPSGY